MKFPKYFCTLNQIKGLNKKHVVKLMFIYKVNGKYIVFTIKNYYKRKLYK